MLLLAATWPTAAASTPRISARGVPVIGSLSSRVTPSTDDPTAEINDSSCGEATRVHLLEWRSTNSVTEHCSINSPRPITTRSSAMSAISASRWLLTSTVLPPRAKYVRMSRIQRMPSGSSPLAGSSRMIVPGSPSMTPAKPRRWRMPSEYPLTRRLAASVSPTRASDSSTRAASIPFDIAIHLRWFRPVRPGCT